MRLCPSDQDLLAFHLGTMPVDRVEDLAAHLEACTTCDETIRGFDAAADPVLSALRLPADKGPSWAHWQTHSADHHGAELGKSDPDPTDPESWPEIPGYEVVDYLGRGGMGVVYKAKDTRLGRLVALKRLRSNDAAETRRSRLEAETLAHLQHPNIVQVHEMPEHEGRLYLVMELLAGEPLSYYLSRPHPPARAAALLEKLARAVHYAHVHGVIHRDLKPANIMLSGMGRQLNGEPREGGASSQTLDLEGLTPKIMDFGVAKRVTAAAAETQNGDVIGTPSYMAPEQASGNAEMLGPATDVYSLGVILYEMLTARVPLLGPTTLDTLLLVRNEDPVAPRQFQPQVPRDLETICLKCLQKEPEHRYATAEELADDLARFLADEPIRARPTPAWERAWKWARRRPDVTGLWAAVVLVSALGLMLVAWQWKRATVAAADSSAAKRVAREEARKAEQLLAGTSLSQGLMLCETGEAGKGLVWLARSVELAERSGERELERAARSNIAAWQPLFVRRQSTFPHEGWTWAVAFSADGRYAVTGGSDRIAQVRDVQSGEPVGKPMRHAHEVWSVAFSPDGSRVLTGSGAYNGRPGEARLWNSATGEPLGPPLAHPSRVTAARFSPNSQTFLTVCDDGAQVWSTETHSAVGVRMSHPGLAPDTQVLQKLEAELTPDGKLVATGGADGSARLWDAATGLPRTDPLRTAGPVSAIALSPDGRTLATGGRHGELERWDVATGVRRGPASRQRGAIKAIAFSGDGAMVAAAGIVNLDDSRAEPKPIIGGEVQLWETGTGGAVGRPLWHPAPVWSVAFSPDDRLLLTGSEDTGVRFFLTMSGQLVGHTYGGEGTVSAVCFSPDGNLALSSSAGGNDHSAGKLWRLPGRKALPRWLFQPGGVSCLALSHDGKTLLTGSPDRSARLWDLEREGPIGQPLNHEHAVVAVAFRPDGREFVTADEGGKVQIWDRARMKPRLTVSHARHVSCAVFSSDGLSFVVGDSSGLVQLYDTADGKAVREYDPKQGPVRGVEFGFGNEAIAAVSDFGVKVLAKSGRRIFGSWSSPPGGNAVSFGLDGKSVLLASDGLTQIAELTTDPPSIRPFIHGAGRAAKLALCPNGRSVLITGVDNITRLWDLATGRALVRGWQARRSRPACSARTPIKWLSPRRTGAFASGTSPRTTSPQQPSSANGSNSIRVSGTTIQGQFTSGARPCSTSGNASSRLGGPHLPKPRVGINIMTFRPIPLLAWGTGRLPTRDRGNGSQTLLALRTIG